MTLQGDPTLVTFKNLDDPSQSSRYTDGLLLELKEKNGRLKLSIRLEENDNDIQTLGGYYLEDCTYVEESSIDGVIICFRDNKTKEIVTITDKNKNCGLIFDKMLKFFESPPQTRNISSPPPRRRSPSPKPKPEHKPKPKLPEDKKANNDVNKLVDALNESNANEAAKYARQLAQNNQSVQFALNLTNESGDSQTPKKKPEPVVEPIKLKVSIESFLIDSADEKQYEVAVMPKTTIRDLKKIISDDAGVPFNQQSWYHGRELLGEDYEFGKPNSSIIDDTLLILYISAPVNT